MLLLAYLFLGLVAASIYPRLSFGLKLGFVFFFPLHALTLGAVMLFWKSKKARVAAFLALFGTLVTAGMVAGRHDPTFPILFFGALTVAALYSNEN